MIHHLEYKISQIITNNNLLTKSHNTHKYKILLWSEHLGIFIV